MGPAWARSRALPCGIPSMTSTRTTSPSSFSTAYWATLAPTLPAPTTVILGRGCCVLRISALPSSIPILFSARRLQRGHALDDGAAELRALHFPGALHQAGEVVGDDLLLDGLLQAGHETVGRIRPAQVAEHHLARENDRSGIHLVLPRIFRRGAVGGLEQRVPRLVVDVGPRRDANAADLGGQRIGEKIA